MSGTGDGVPLHLVAFDLLSGDEVRLLAARTVLDVAPVAEPVAA